MIKIQDIVRDIVYENEEALSALAEGYMNFSKYAQKIKAEVERRTKKDVHVPGIVVALSRVEKSLEKKHPLLQDIKLNSITTKSPVSEIVFEKSPVVLSCLSKVYEKVKTTSDDFLAMTLSSSEVTVICSDRIKTAVLAHFKEKPRMVEGNLAAVGLSIDPKYYQMPNITFSLLRKIARKRIVLAETITTHTEIIFVFNKKYIGEVLELFN